MSPMNARPEAKSKSKRGPRKADAAGDSTPPDVYILSDSTGSLARHMLAAFMTQFPIDSIAPHFHTFIRGEKRLGEILEHIKARPGAICYAMVSDALKKQ